MNTVPVSTRSPIAAAWSVSRGPDRGGQPVGAVVHQRDRLLVVAHLHDADDRPETLLAHDAHLVVDIGQHFRRQIGRACLVLGDLHVDVRLGALAQRFGLLLADEVGEARLRHRPHRRRLVERIADDVVLGPRDEAFDEFVIDLLVDVDALDAAAALAGIVEGAVDEIGDGMVELRRRAAHRPDPCRRVRGRAS